MPDAITLQNQTLRLVLNPHFGGCIQAFLCNDVPILRSNARLDSAAKSGCYPLAPYSNRIANGQFSHSGQTYQIEKNFDNHPHSIHGIAWQRAWSVLNPVARPYSPSYLSPDLAPIIKSETHCLSLQLIHQAGITSPGGILDWPFAFTATQHFKLSSSALEVQMELRNDAAQPVPVGLGWHPYFNLRNASRIHTSVSGRWENNTQMLPSRWIDCNTDPSPYVHRDNKDTNHSADLSGAVAEMAFDHCFTGWSGQAEIHDSLLSLRLSSNMDYLVVFTPQGKDYFCLEPVSHRNNAINTASPNAAGLRTLAPGESHSVWMRLEVLTASTQGKIS